MNMYCDCFQDAHLGGGRGGGKGGGKGGGGGGDGLGTGGGLKIVHESNQHHIKMVNKSDMN